MQDNQVQFFPTACHFCTLSNFAGFIAGPRADALAHVTQEQAVQKFLGQLDEIFSSTSNPKPASSSYVKAHVFDWSREEWVGGAYTFPSYGAEEGDRQALAAPVAGTLFFAGGCMCVLILRVHIVSVQPHVLCHIIIESQSNTRTQCGAGSTPYFMLVLLSHVINSKQALE